MARSRDIANLLGSSSPIVDKTIIDAKGDLLIGSADNTPAKLTAGNNGEILFSDSSATNGLRYQPVYSTGKNKIINGDFSTWQRGTSFTTGNAVYQYTADRWQAYWYGNNTTTVSQQSFTPGSAPVAGQEGSYFLRINSTQTAVVLRQLIEDVRTFAGQNIVVSFWAKAASATSVSVYANQIFGTGGSAVVEPGAVNVSINSSWARYSINLSIPSISGKTIGTNSYLALHLTSGINNAVDLWGVQMESGNVATAFEQEPYAETLRKCQRYYYVHAIGNNQIISLGSYYTSGSIYGVINFPVTMRIKPTYVTTVGTDYYVIWRNGGGDYFNNFSDTTIGSTNSTLWGNVVEMSGTAGQVGDVRTSNASSLVAFSAEL